MWNTLSKHAHKTVSRSRLEISTKHEKTHLFERINPRGYHVLCQNPECKYKQNCQQNTTPTVH